MSKPYYVEIVEKVFEKTKDMRTDEFKWLGKIIQRWDAVDKVTGKPLFTLDLVNRIRDAVFLYTVRTKYAHARIKKIDVSDAARYPGVIRVITAKDIPGVNDVGYVIPDQPLIADKKVRYIGDTVAVIVAENYHAAVEAADLVSVEYEPLRPILDPLEIVEWGGLREKEHELIHEERGSDVVSRYKIRRGDIKKAEQEAAVIVENEYRTPFQEHAYLEPEAAIAWVEADGSVSIIASTQCPFDVRKAVSQVLGLPFNKVRVRVPLLGGGFGGKEDVANDIASKAALAAVLTGRPAIIFHTREESIIGHSKRHPMIARYRHMARRDGTLLGVEAEIILDTGAYASLGPFVGWRAIVHSTGPYKVPNAKVDLAVVYTNHVYAGAFRGFGSPQVTFAFERQMDLLAEELGIDPVDLRLKNILRNGDRTVHGQLLDHGVGLEEAIKKVVEASNWYEKRKLYGKPQGNIVRGIGISAFYHGNSIGAEGADFSTATIIINRDGTITYRTGLTDFGQGAQQGIMNIIAEVLGVPPSYIHLEPPDTSATPDAGPTVASRSTVMGGNAALVAAYRLRERLNKLAAELLGCSEDEIVIDAPDVYCRSDKSLHMTWQELVEQAFWKGVPLQEFGYFRAPPAEWDEETGQGAPYMHYTFGAVVTEVVVDLETGVVRVERAYTAYDIGRVINRVGAELHAEGGFIQGMGYALMEDIYHSKEGYVYNKTLSTYHVPLMLDTPEEIKSFFVEAGFKRGPFGAKGLGEPSITGIAASIANAVAHALSAGKLINAIPLTPDRVYMVIKKKGLNPF